MTTTAEAQGNLVRMLTDVAEGATCLILNEDEPFAVVVPYQQWVDRHTSEAKSGNKCRRPGCPVHSRRARRRTRKFLSWADSEGHAAWARGLLR